jgi:fumarylacetoacetase
MGASAAAPGAVELGVPCEIGDYTDFYAGIHHATTVGRQFRPTSRCCPTTAGCPSATTAGPPPAGQRLVLPSTHGAVQGARCGSARAGTLCAAGHRAGAGHFHWPAQRPGRAGVHEEAEQHVFGITLFNDWSARDIQAWEYQPLGPFLSKNFASTVSPWMVTMEALEPFRQPFSRPEGDPDPLPYLDSADNRTRGAIAIQMEVVLQTARMAREGHAGDVISRSNFAEAAYWTVAQLVAHHTVNGCALRAVTCWDRARCRGRPWRRAALCWS